MRSSIKHGPLVSAIPQQNDVLIFGFLTLRKTAMIQAYPGILVSCIYAQPSDLQRLIGYSLCMSMIDYQYINPAVNHTAAIYTGSRIPSISQKQLTRVTAGSQHPLHLPNVKDTRFKGESKSSNIEKTSTTKEN
jgi:hypothetical protein